MSFRSGSGRVSMLPSSGASGVDVTCPLFLYVMPLTFLRFFLFCMFLTSSSEVCSPSPRMMMSMYGYFLSMRSALNVAW